MTRNERVKNALHHKESDIIPYFAEFTGQEKDKIAKYLHDKDFESKYQMHIHYIQYWGWPTELHAKPGFFLDEYGVAWNRSGADRDIGVVDEPLIGDISNHNYTIPPINEKRLRAEYKALMQTADDRFKMIGFGFTVFERAWSLCGMPQVLMAMIEHPAALTALLDKICEYNLSLLRIALSYDVEGIYFGDDWGQQKGLIMGPAHWRKFIKPVIKKMYAEVKNAGKYVFQHSCGDIEEIFPDLIDLGLDCYQTFQPEIYDIKKVKKEFGKHLCFWGGISTQQLLPYATPEQIKTEVANIMRIMGKGGGYIAAPTHAVPQDVPPENIFAMMEVFENQDKYL